MATEIAATETTRKKAVARPVAAELSPDDEGVGQLVFPGHGCLLQHLVDATEQPFVRRAARNARQGPQRWVILIPRIDTCALKRQRGIVRWVTSLVV